MRYIYNELRIQAKVFRERMQLLIAVDGGKADKLFPETETLFMVKIFLQKLNLSIQ